MYIAVELRRKFGDSTELDADQLLDEIGLIKTELYSKAKEDLYDVLYDQKIDLAKLVA